LVINRYWYIATAKPFIVYLYLSISRISVCLGLSLSSHISPSFSLPFSLSFFSLFFFIYLSIYFSLSLSLSFLSLSLSFILLTKKDLISPIHAFQYNSLKTKVRKVTRFDYLIWYHISSMKRSHGQIIGKVVFPQKNGSSDTR
jgi:hypothetical protein